MVVLVISHQSKVADCVNCERLKSEFDEAKIEVN